MASGYIAPPDDTYPDPDEGTAESSAPTPVITSVVPHYGRKEGGDTVTISGSNFDPTNLKVKFRVGKSVGHYAKRTGCTNCTTANSCTGTNINDDGVAYIDSATSTCIVLKTPKSNGGFGGAKVIVKNLTSGNGGSLAWSNSNGQGFKYGYAPPTVTGISVNHGPITGGTAVTITGSGFVSGVTATIGTIAVTITSLGGQQSDGTYTTITGTTGSGGFWNKACSNPPAPVTGAPVNILVINPDGQSFQLPSAFTYDAALMTISGITPGSGPSTGNTTVKITGTNLKRITAVYFGTVMAPCNSYTINANNITLPSPVGCGSVPIKVQNADNAMVTSTALFTYTPVSPSTPSITPTTFTCTNNATATLTASLTKGAKPCDDISLASYVITYASGSAQTEIQITATPTVTNSSTTATIAFPLKFSNCPCGNAGVVTENFKLTITLSTAAGTYGPYQLPFKTQTLPTACGSLSASATASPTQGPPPLSVHFVGSATGGVPQLSYNWLFGDGSSSTWAETDHTYMTANTYNATFTVTDATANQASAHVSVKVQGTTTM
jgi:hypothetical protein